MDAETRHELQQNELGQFLARLKSLSAREILTYLGVIVVVILAIVGYRTWQSSQLAAKSQAWTDLITAGAPRPGLDGNLELPDRVEALRNYMQTHDEPSAMSAARLRLARALIDKAATDGAQRQLLLDEALTHLDALRADNSAPPALRAAATLLAGTAYETRRDAAKAREMYRLFENADLSGSAIADIARRRLETIDQVSARVAFVPGSPPPPPAPEPVTPAETTPPPATSAAEPVDQSAPTETPTPTDDTPSPAAEQPDGDNPAPATPPADDEP